MRKLINDESKLRKVITSQNRGSYSLELIAIVVVVILAALLAFSSFGSQISNIITDTTNVLENTTNDVLNRYSGSGSGGSSGGAGDPVVNSEFYAVVPKEASTLLFVDDDIAGEYLRGKKSDINYSQYNGTAYHSFESGVDVISDTQGKEFIVLSLTNEESGDEYYYVGTSEEYVKNTNTKYGDANIGDTFGSLTVYNKEVVQTNDVIGSSGVYRYYPNAIYELYTKETKNNAISNGLLTASDFTNVPESTPIYKYAIPLKNGTKVIYSTYDRLFIIASANKYKLLRTNILDYGYASSEIESGFMDPDLNGTNAPVILCNWVNGTDVNSDFSTPDNSLGIPEADGSVLINSANFPDDVFRTLISDNYDTDKNGILSLEEREDVTAIDISTGEFISSLKGIEYFTKITSFGCYDSLVTYLDLSQNTELQEISIINTPISSLDLSHNTKLIGIEIMNAWLDSLDLSHNPLLEESNVSVDESISVIYAS